MLILFMTLMNSLFCNYVSNFVLVFMDDILIYSENKDEHKLHLKQVFEILRAYAGLSKCVFL